MSTLRRFPALLSGLVLAVLRGEESGPDDRRGSNNTNTVAIDDGEESDDGNDNVGGTVGCRGGGETEFPAKAPQLLDPLFDGLGGGVSFAWEDLAAPAARLCAACQPFDAVQVDVLDKVIGDIYRRRR